MSDWYSQHVQNGIYRPPSSPVICMDGPKAGRVYHWFDHVKTFSVTAPDFENPYSLRMIAHQYNIVTMWGTLVKVAFHAGSIR